MRTPISIMTLLAASSAFAQSTPIHLTEDDLPPAQQKPLANNPHAEHQICHTSLHWIDTRCADIRALEQRWFQTEALAAPQEQVLLPDGTYKTGRRDVYDAKKVVGGSWDTTFSARVWGNRFKPLLSTTAPGATLHPEWEGTAAINSCDEYGYKRYYQANRQLDAINSLAASNRYIEALDVILVGAPASGTTKGFGPVSAPALTDYDGYPIKSFAIETGGVQRPAISAPLNQNPFFSVPDKLIRSLNPTTEPWTSRIGAALDQAATRTPNKDHNTWEYANKIRLGTVPEAAPIKAMSRSERDDIAGRISRMRKALSTATRNFQQCVNERFRAQTASTTQLPNGQTMEEFLYAITDPGTINPVDFDEIALQASLVDQLQYSSTLSGVLTTSLTSTDKLGAYARTRLGQAMRNLNSVNSSAFASAMAGTTYSFKSGSANLCNGAYYDVARLLVEEYDRADHGCLGSGPKCDFSIPVFVEQVSDRLNTMIADVDTAKDVCTTYLGTNFDGQTKVPTGNRANVAVFEAFFKKRKQDIDVAIRGAPRNSSLPNSIGDRQVGYANWGDPKSFGAGYSYESEWGINIIQKATDTKGNLYACRLGGHVEGNLRAWVTMFGADEDLVDAGLTAHTVQTDKTLSTTEKQMYWDAHITLLGIDVYQSPDDKLISPSFAQSDDNRFDVPLVHTTIILGFIPVTISAGFGFEYGYNLQAKFSQSNCQPSPTLKLWGSVTPHAAAEAFVEAYVDLFIVGAGVKGTLTLVKAELPFRADLKVVLDGTGSLAVSASSSLNLFLTELSGSISFIVKVFGITAWEHDLFKWEGIRQSLELWKANVTFPFIAYDILPTIPEPQ